MKPGVTVRTDASPSSGVAPTYLIMSWDDYVTLTRLSRWRRWTRRLRLPRLGASVLGAWGTVQAMGFFAEIDRLGKFCMLALAFATGLYLGLWMWSRR